MCSAQVYSILNQHANEGPAGFQGSVSKRSFLLVITEMKEPLLDHNFDKRDRFACTSIRSSATPAEKPASIFQERSGLLINFSMTFSRILKTSNKKTILRARL